MPRDIPVGNGDLLITFDRLYRVRDIYFPCVGMHNHTDGHVQRVGVWADGVFAWIEDPLWRRHLRYATDSLVTEVRLSHDRLGLELICRLGVSTTIGIIAAFFGLGPNFGWATGKLVIPGRRAISSGMCVRQPPPC